MHRKVRRYGFVHQPNVAQSVKHIIADGEDVTLCAYGFVEYTDGSGKVFCYAEDDKGLMTGVKKIIYPRHIEVVLDA